MWRNIVLLLGVALSAMILAGTTIPLGIVGEWTWPRHPLPENVPELLDRFLPPTLLAVGLLAFCRFADCRIKSAARVNEFVFVGLLVFGSYHWQHAAMQAAPSPHRELRPLWVLYDRYASGYFFEAAFNTNSQAELLSTYEARMAKGDVLHEGTHPPGLFLLNWWACQTTQRSETLVWLAEWTQSSETIRLFRELEANSGMAKRALSRTELAALCLVSFLSSLLSAMTIIPVYGIVRLLSDRRTAWRAACLMLTIPTIAVFAPRSDIVYAFSASLIIWAVVAAMMAQNTSRRIALSVSAATVTFASLYVSLAHIPAIVVTVIFAALSLVGSNRLPWRDVLKAIGMMTVSFLALCLVVGWMTQCNLLRIWQMNLTNHAGFYGQSTRTSWKWLLANPLELAFSLGLPLAYFSIAGGIRAFRNILQPGETTSVRTIAFPRLLISMMATWVMLWMSGKNMGEAARLWCFLTPWFVLAAVSVFEPKSDAEKPMLTDSSDWLKLLAAQFVVCALTAGCVSGYETLT